MAVLCDADEPLALEIICRLSRKVEPEISAVLFPLPFRVILLPHRRFLRPSGTHTTTTLFSIPWMLATSGLSPLDLFEYTLRRSHLTVASHLLTLACEHAGGTENKCSVGVSLGLALELFYSCLRCAHFSLAKQAGEFCLRLQEMWDVVNNENNENNVGEAGNEEVSLLVSVGDNNSHCRIGKDVFSFSRRGPIVFNDRRR